jgi:hypothetical protein
METQQSFCVAALKHSLCSGVFGNGSGKLGAISNSIGAAAVITLVNTSDIINFWIGQKLVFAADEASALRDSGATLTVIAIDESTGQVTVNDDLDTISGLAQLDSIFTEGDYTAASQRNRIRGLDAWIPATAPTTGDSFFSMDRSVYPTWLAGHRLVASTAGNLTTVEAAQSLGTHISRSGKRCDIGIVNPARLQDVITELSTKIQYTQVSAPINNAKGEKLAEVGFTAVRIMTPQGAIDLIGDAYCPLNTLYVLKKSSWEFKSLGQAPRWVEPKVIEASNDGVEIRLAFYGNLRCLEPGANGRFDW